MSTDDIDFEMTDPPTGPQRVLFNLGANTYRGTVEIDDLEGGTVVFRPAADTRGSFDDARRALVMACRVGGQELRGLDRNERRAIASGDVSVEIAR